MISAAFIATRRENVEKNYLVELQSFLDGGGQLTHEQGVRFFDEFLKQAASCPTRIALCCYTSLARSEKSEAAAPAGGISPARSRYRSLRCWP